MTPQYQILVDGRDITETIAENFIRLSITDKIGLSADTVDFSIFFDGSFTIPRAGVTLEIKIGYAETGLWDAGRFIVEETNLSGVPDVLSVRGISMPLSPQSSIEALQGSTDRVWQSYDLEQTTFSAVVNAVCGDAGLSTKIAKELANIKMPYTWQIAETDAEFLTRITQLRNGIIKYREDQVLFEIKDSDKLDTVKIEQTECMSYDFTFSERTDIKSITAKYQVNEDGEVKMYTAGSGDPHKILRFDYPDLETATEAAESLLKKLQRETIETNISLPTKPGLLAEAKIELSGFPDDSLNKSYIISEATHNLEDGLISEITAKQRA